VSQQISTIALVVPDYDAAISFYVGTMDFWLLTNEDKGGGKRWVTVVPTGGGTALLLAKAVNADQTCAIGNQTGGRVGFILQTDDFARDHAKMRAKGVTFEEAPRIEPYGTVAVWRDPFGNRWDLLQDASASETPI